MLPDPRARLQETLSGSYTIERELGGGGMSRVYLAQDTALGRTVVIKVIDSAKDSAFILRMACPRWIFTVISLVPNS